MKRAAIVLLLLALSSTKATAQSEVDTSATELPRAVLSKVYAPTLGEMVAQTITQVLVVFKPIDAPMLAVYDKGMKKVELSVMGGRNSVDGAKQSLDELREKGYPLIALVVGQTYHVSIDDADITLVYVNRLDSYKEVVRRENGRYVVPE